ncbi:MAG: HD domain-containing protein [Ruminococcus sp.]|nr:HD domain-containing protein [Ruminococcus sp.]
MKINIPEKVLKITERLNNNGYEAYIVGGCVRDSLAGICPHDWDICTNALPEQTKLCFKDYKIFDAGIKHGTISVVSENEVFEITTYRIDGEYSDNRHPENVTFTRNIIDDLARRDFTVNAIAYNNESGLVDPFNGFSDLKSGIIRCVREPDERFNEDGLRIIRALRFASVYGFEIEEKTAKSIIKNKGLLNNISAERISVELLKLLCGKGAENILNTYREVFAEIIPELACEFDYDQCTKHHCYDLWHHTTYAVGAIKNTPVLRMVMLLHDIAKPECCKKDADGTSHFKGHPIVSAEKARIILHRLKFSNAFTDDCIKLIKYHDVRLNGTKRHILRMMNKLGKNLFPMLIEVQYADIAAQSDYQRQEKLKNIDISKRFYYEILEEDSCFSLRQLAINGNDLIKIGITEGKLIGNILKALLEMVLDEEIKNDKDMLIEKAHQLANELYEK